MDDRSKALLRSQQGELDAVLMYRRLAETARDERDRRVFRVLAEEEQKHAEVFGAHTQAALRPKKTKAILLPLLYRVIGKKRLYPLIAKGEYDAAAKYEHLIPDFPEAAKVRDDETHHGNMIMALL